MYRIPLFAAIVISVCVLIPVAMRGNQSRVRVELLRNIDLPINLGRLRDRRRECISPQPIGNSSLNRDT